MIHGSREIIDIVGDVTKAAAANCIVTAFNCNMEFEERECPPINYIFGNPTYWKDRLDELSKTPTGNEMKLPLIALNCPFVEERNKDGLYTQAKVWIMIACSTLQQWSNEERAEYSFRNILRPIYRAFMAALADDRRLSIDYDGVIPHQYSENYSYGRYGAITPDGKEVSEPIDAIIISNLELKVKLPNCR